MLFNSLNFILFLPIVFAIYWIISPKRFALQNIFLLVSSYFFYSCWDFRFMFLLLFSTLLDFYSGLKINSTTTIRSKKFWFWLSIGLNLGFLGVFKYYNFFIESFADLFALGGYKINIVTLQVILPVGISFYTFHGLSYVIDVYNKKVEPERNFVNYALFVSFFPLLVAGPIERATHLLPQIKKVRFFDYAMAVNGLRQVLWGLFKKVVIADACAEYANIIFDGYDGYSGSTLFVGALFFTFQIYCDFSGYSDIALGVARLFGVELLKNFSFPYFSRDIAEFWRRWHISLSSWFRDYLYIPLGGSKVSTLKRVRNTFIIFIVSGFWHGANWTFIFWGALNALYFLPLLLSKRNRVNLEIIAHNKLLPSFNEGISMTITFLLTVLAWVFFRAENLRQAFGYLKGMCSSNLFSVPTIRPLNLFFLIIVFILIEWFGREGNYAIEKLFLRNNSFVRRVFYFAICIAIFLSIGKEQKFIYFQF